jgi:hypothetical protein
MYAGLSADYVAALQRHASLYRQPPPVYSHSAQAPYWVCNYLGHTVATLNLTDGKADVARVMYLTVTVNRPMPLTPVSFSIW